MRCFEILLLLPYFEYYMKSYRYFSIHYQIIQHFMMWYMDLIGSVNYVLYIDEMRKAANSRCSEKFH